MSVALRGAHAKRRGEERDQLPALQREEDALKVEVTATAAVTRAHIAEREAKAHHAFFCDPPSSWGHVQMTSALGGG